NPDSADTQAIRRELNRTYNPNRIIGHSGPMDGEGGFESASPLLKGKTLVDGKAALYICRDFTCQAPVSDPSQVQDRFGEQGKLMSDNRRETL
ncbi:MAG TPA: hypothetical protein VLB09_07250, partial [Nitrospiria bacterium]|nr:hypothetical protein [Nitrospiria bacterium]